MSGFVSLVGAGCAPGLLTLLGEARLRECDAVVYDDLIDRELLRMAGDAELIYMGKRAGRPSAGQEDICAELIRLAREGKRVVRLKGGDPYIFGRGGEEMAALAAAGVPCEAVPGVSSAYAIPELAGIPLTHRGLARGFAVVTASVKDGAALPDYFDTLASFPGTLVVLMGLGKLGEIASRLTRAGSPGSTPCAVVSGGSAPERYCLRGTLSDIAAKAQNCPGPAVIVIGECAAMELPAGALPLSGVRVGLTGTARLNAKLARELTSLGAEPFTACELELVPTAAAADTPTDCDCLVFTSAAGVDLYFENLLKSGRDARALASTRLAAIGKATASALRKYALSADIVAPGQNSASLADELMETLDEGASVCLYRSAAGDRALAARLAERYRVRDIAAYEAVPGKRTAGRELIERADAFTFTSAAGARAALEKISPLPERAVLAAIGERCAAPLAGLPNPKLCAGRPDVHSLADAIAGALGRANK
ncbi:MAG TPA: uroporphyrinogen-III C-methyltransferase [Candidatus Scatomorpha merdigallinarum]|nr:uroporphyrinogen-III C-methyltransferase [Candidatus Scatomorpha merdigallinarum]